MALSAKKQKAGRVAIFAVLLAVLIFAWLGSYWLKYHNWPWNDIKSAVNNAKNKNIPENATTTIQNNEAKIEPSPEQKNSQAFRQAAMDDLSGKIGQLSPVQPVLGGHWFVDRFWFADDNDVYIEYEDGHILRRILVSVDGQEGNFKYKAVGYFEPGENDWILKQGKDTMIGKRLDLYEFDQAKGEWAKKN
jgi:hypothetical protein